MITPVIGRKYKLIGNSSWSGGRPQDYGQEMTVGRLYECIGLNNARPPFSPNHIIHLKDDNGVLSNVYIRDLADGWATRKEHAEFLEQEVKDLDKARKELDKKESEMRFQIKRLKEFDSDEEEIAAMMVRAMKESELSEKDAIKNLAKTLKGRLRTDLL